MQISWIYIHNSWFFLPGFHQFMLEDMLFSSLDYGRHPFNDTGSIVLRSFWRLRFDERPFRLLAGELTARGRVLRTVGHSQARGGWTDRADSTSARVQPRRPRRRVGSLPQSSTGGLSTRESLSEEWTNRILNAAGIGAQWHESITQRSDRQDPGSKQPQAVGQWLREGARETATSAGLAQVRKCFFRFSREFSKFFFVLKDKWSW